MVPIASASPTEIRSPHVESDRRELSLVEHVRDAFQPATRQPSTVQEPVPQISVVTSVRHYPASLTHFREDGDPMDPDPLFLVSMGDHIPSGWASDVLQYGIFVNRAKRPVLSRRLLEIEFSEMLS
jgi:hypothetical protein